MEEPLGGRVRPGGAMRHEMATSRNRSRGRTGIMADSSPGHLVQFDIENGWLASASVHVQAPEAERWGGFFDRASDLLPASRARGRSRLQEKAAPMEASCLQARRVLAVCGRVRRHFFSSVGPAIASAVRLHARGIEERRAAARPSASPLQITPPPRLARRLKVHQQVPQRIARVVRAVLDRGLPARGGRGRSGSSASPRSARCTAGRSLSVSRSSRRRTTSIPSRSRLPIARTRQPRRRSTAASLSPVWLFRPSPAGSIPSHASLAAAAAGPAPPARASAASRCASSVRSRSTYSPTICHRPVRAGPSPSRRSHRPQHHQRRPQPEVHPAHDATSSEVEPSTYQQCLHVPLRIEARGYTLSRVCGLPAHRLRLPHALARPFAAA